MTFKPRSKWQKREQGKSNQLQLGRELENQNIEVAEFLGNLLLAIF